MTVFSLPKNLTVNYVEDFLSTVEKTFKWKDQAKPDIAVNLQKVEKIDIIGLLVLYKYIDFTYHNYCFKKPKLNSSPFMNSAWKKYEFEELFLAFIENKGITDKAYKDFKVKVEDKFIIAPQALLRNTSYTSEYLKQEFIPKIESYYKFDSKCVDIIFGCFSEILLNFWEHAPTDTKSVIIADGNKSKIEIACADTGIGIVENLFKFYKGKIPKDQILRKALEKGVTSKPNSNHMGFGLWLVNELVTANNGRFYLYSQGFYYHNNFGKIKSGKFPFWPGTIVYVNINLTKPKNLSDILNGADLLKIKINFT